MARKQPLPEGFECIDTVRTAKAPTAYWGNWIVKDTILLASGYGGISKTTLFYALILSLIDEGHFLGVEGEQNLKILYFDLESTDSLEKARMKLISRLDTDHPNFYRYNRPDKSLKQLKPEIEKFIENKWKPDIMVFDPLSLLFPNTQNENSNAEATRQSKLLRSLRQEWDTTFILVSHSSKMDLYGAGHNRGASARAFLADINWNFHGLGQGFPEDLFVLHIPKNRWIHDEFFQCIRKQEGEFLPAELPKDFTFQPTGESGLTTYQLQLKIEDILKDGVAREMKAILSATGYDPDDVSETTRRTFYRAITPLVQLDKIDRVSRGMYQWIGSSIN